MRNGVKLYDTNGNELHAHGGHMLWSAPYWYWYGEDRRDGIYVSCYRSTDLEAWEFVCHSLTIDSKTESINGYDTSLYHITEDDSKDALYDSIPAEIKDKRHKVNIERPKVLYNGITGKYVMWMHYENGRDYSDARCAIATSDTPDGAFIYHGSFNPCGEMSRDCTLYNDGNKTYFISASRENADLHMYSLTEDYMGIEAQVSSLWNGEYREAPAVFKKAGKYYMLSSFCTGWAPNQGKYASADKIDGEWTKLELFGDETTFGSQPAFVLPINKNGEEHFYYIADRWNAKYYFDSTYVILEIQFDNNGNPYIEYTDEITIL